jgi:hypothetical protein
VVDRALRSARAPQRLLTLVLAGSLSLVACERASSDDATEVVLDNAYAPSSGLVVYRAVWAATSFDDPVVPGTSYSALGAYASSENAVYVVLAPDWDPTSHYAPPTFIVLKSRTGFSVHLENTLHIPVDDAHFDGNCRHGSVLTQADADFITQIVFANVFAGLKYEAATCRLTGDSSAR